jgi:hypothetical protein
MKKKFILRDDDISPNILNNLINGKQIDKNDLKNDNDYIAMRFAFPYDINYAECLKELKDNLESYYALLNDKRFETAYMASMKYIDERIDHNVRN